MFGITIGGCSCVCGSSYNILSLDSNGNRRYALYTNSFICYHVQPVGDSLYSGSLPYSGSPVVGPLSGALQKWNSIGSTPSREWYSDYRTADFPTGPLSEPIVGISPLPTRQDDRQIVVSADGYIYVLGGTDGEFVTRLMRYSSTGRLDKFARSFLKDNYKGGIRLGGSYVQAATAGGGGRIYDFNSDLSAGGYGIFGGLGGSPLNLNIINPWPTPTGWAELSTSLCHFVTNGLVLGNVNNQVRADIGDGGASAYTPDGTYLYIASMTTGNLPLNPSKLSKVTLPAMSGVAYPPGVSSYGTYEWQVNHGMTGSQIGNDPSSQYSFWGLTADKNGGVWMFNKTTLKHFVSGGTSDVTITMPGATGVNGVNCVRAYSGSDVIVFGNFYGAASKYNVARVSVASTSPVWTAVYGKSDNPTIDSIRDGHVSDAGDIYTCGTTVESP